MTVIHSPLTRAKKIEIIVENTFAPQIIDLLKQGGAKGYTLLPTLTSEGRHGYRGYNDIIDVFHNVLIISIVSMEKADAVIQLLACELPDLSGIFCVSEVEVLRKDHF